MWQIPVSIDDWVDLITNPQVAATIVFSLVMLYLTVPVLLIRSVFVFKYPTTIVQFDLNDLAMPTDARQYLLQCDKGLRELGYEPVACFGLPDLVPNVQSLNALYINQIAREGAMVNLAYAELGIKTRNVEFCRRYDSGGMLCTNNSSTLGAFRNPANHHTYYYPDISDIAQLHKIHRCIDKDLGYGRPKLTLYDSYGGDVERYVQQEVILAPCDYQCQIGWLYKIPSGFAATWKGAAIITWGLMFPFKQIRMFRAKRRANALADKLCGIKGKQI